MDSFKNSWTLEMAMAVLENKTTDSKTWSEAVEWLLLYGPPEIRQLLGQASHTATSACYPDLKPTGYTPDGEPCYHIDDIADSLGISREEAIQKMIELEEIHGFRHLYDDEETLKIQ
jgi:hypothetical protein